MQSDTEPLEDAIGLHGRAHRISRDESTRKLIEMVTLEERLALCAAHLERMRP